MAKEMKNKEFKRPKDRLPVPGIRTSRDGAPLHGWETEPERKARLEKERKERLEAAKKPQATSTGATAHGAGSTPARSGGSD